MGHIYVQQTNPICFVFSKLQSQFLFVWFIQVLRYVHDIKHARLNYVRFVVGIDVIWGNILPILLGNM